MNLVTLIMFLVAGYWFLVKKIEIVKINQQPAASNQERATSNELLR